MGDKRGEDLMEKYCGCHSSKLKIKINHYIACIKWWFYLKKIKKLGFVELNENEIPNRIRRLEKKCKYACNKDKNLEIALFLHESGSYVFVSKIDCSINIPNTNICGVTARSVEEVLEIMKNTYKVELF